MNFKQFKQFLDPDVLNLLDKIAVGLYIYQERIIFANKKGLELLPFPLEQLRQKGVWKLFPQSFQEIVKENIKKRINGEFLDFYEYSPIKIHSLTSGKRWIRIITKTIRFKGEYLGIAVAIDISHEKNLEKKLVRLANVDPLTGLFNRRKFFQELQKEVARAQRYKHPLSLIMVDIDDFKEVNDKYGHNTGDKILRRLAEVFINSVRTVDVVARYGGEEFLILLPELNIAKATKVAEKLREITEDIFKDIIPITISLGVVQFQERESLDNFIKRADEAMYNAKNLGKNKVVAL